MTNEVDMEDHGNEVQCDMIVLYVCMYVSDGLLATGHVSPYIIIYMTQLIHYSNVLGVLFFSLKHIGINGY